MWFVPDPTQLAPASRAVLGMKMELYAGMVENMDMHVGRLVDYLKSIGEFENTIFIVFGDNGAEGTDLFKMVAGTPGTLNYLNAAVNWSQSDSKAWGNPESFVGHGPMWAQVSMTPFSQYKGWLAEGGVRNALIVSGPVVNRPKGSVHDTTMHVTDIMPTLLEVAEVDYTKTNSDKTPPPLIGKSWLDMLQGNTDSVRSSQDYIGWELFGNRAIRQGDWKLRWQWRPFGSGDWELFNLATDPSERTDLALVNQRKLSEMLSLWSDYVEQNNVILPSLSTYENLENQLPERFPDDLGYPPLIYKKQYIPPQEMVRE